MTKKPSAWLIIGAVLVLSGCDPAYLFHAALGQLRFLHSAVPIREALSDPSLTPDERERLEWVARIKAFGEENLGLKRTTNYETVSLSISQPPIYTVSAAPKDRLSSKTWWFPFIGEVPYLGFFDLKRAREERDRLMALDLDVSVGVADAYSTLGWFQDPVTLNLLRGSFQDLTETILHEMTHTTLYVKGQGAFNEGLAVLVGEVGACLFFEHTFGPSHPHALMARAWLADERIFSRFIGKLMDDLERLYGSSLSYEEKMVQREHVFAAARESFHEVSKLFRTDRFCRFDQRPLNNATILAVGLYHRHFDLFEAVLEKRGGSVPDLIAFFRDLSHQNHDVIQSAKRWLEGQEASHIEDPRGNDRGVIHIEGMDDLPKHPLLHRRYHLSSFLEAFRK